MRGGRINGLIRQSDENGGDKFKVQGYRTICENPETITEPDTRLICFRLTDLALHYMYRDVI